MREPLLDPDATARAGAPRELLADMTAPAPVPPPAHRLSPGAWAMLQDAKQRGLRAGRSPEGRLLRDAGLLNGVGGTTSHGQQLLDGVGTGARRVSARWAGPAGVGTWTCWIRDAAAVVAVRTAPDDAALEQAPLAIDLLTTSVAVARLLERLEVGPVWTLGDANGADDPLAVADDVVAARILAADAPLPAGAGPLLQRAWRSEPWTAHLVRTEGSGDRPGPELRLLHAGEAGWLRSEPVDEDSSRLVPVPPADLVRRLLDLLLGAGAHG